MFPPASSILLTNKAMVVPFRDNEEGRGLLSVSREVLSNLTGVLRGLFMTRLWLGGFMPSWTSYQAKLAIEEFLWGHPLSKVDTLWSVSLGTNSGNPNSMTHQRGFLGLAPANSACVGSEPPPITNWTQDNLQHMRIVRVFPFCAALEAAPAVLGAAVIRVLICDLLQKNKGIPYSQLSATTPPGELKGPIQVCTLASNLAKKEYFFFPTTFSRAKQILRQKGLDVEEVLLAGFQHMMVRWFLALTYYDL